MATVGGVAAVGHVLLSGAWVGDRDSAVGVECNVGLRAVVVEGKRTFARRVVV